MIEFNDIRTRQGLFYVKQSGNRIYCSIYIYIYIFCVIVLKTFLYIVIWYQVFLSNTKNCTLLYDLKYSNQIQNILYTIICFQVIFCIW